MLSIIRKKGLLKIEEVWFKDSECLIDSDADIISYNQVEKPFGYIDRQSDTLVSDLLPSEEEILSKIDKDYRYEIRRAIRENVLCKMIDSNIDDASIRDFAENYEEFCKTKGMSHIATEEMISILSEYNKKGGLAISQAFIDDIKIVWHVYIYDHNVCRLMYSISHYRENTSIKKSLVGMANRLLHYEDMISFKNKGCKEYDWGGIEDSEEIKNITDFKIKFGGKRKTVYYVRVGNTLKGKAALKVKYSNSRR